MLIISRPFRKPAFPAETVPQIRLTSTTDKNGVNFPILDVILGNFVLSDMPKITGSSTTFKVEPTKSAAFTDTYEPASKEERNGVMNTAAAVLAAVMSTDNAKSALAIIVTRLEAVPPGEHPTRIRPVARGGGNWKILAKNAALNGIIVYCARKPIATHLGVFKTFLKSSSVSVSPMDIIVRHKAFVT